MLAYQHGITILVSLTSESFDYILFFVLGYRWGAYVTQEP